MVGAAEILDIGAGGVNQLQTVLAVDKVCYRAGLEAACEGTGGRKMPLLLRVRVVTILSENHALRPLQPLDFFWNGCRRRPLEVVRTPQTSAHAITPP